MLTLLPKLTPKHALFLDFDGTLAPLQDDPDSVVLPEGGAEILLGQFEVLSGALVLISGRSVQDLAVRVPSGVWRAGGHGLDICAPGDPVPENPGSAPDGLKEQIAAIVSGVDGARMEDKGAVLAIHYRDAPTSGTQLRARLDKLITDYDGYKIQAGKMVLEAKPERAHKGRALSHLMTLEPFKGRVPIMVGDDTTDEDAMRVARSAGGIAIKVGRGPTVADFRVNDPSAIWTWLERGME